MCNCDICQQSREVDSIKNKGDINEMTILIYKLHKELVSMSLDNERYEALFIGKLPNSEKLLNATLKKIRKKKCG